uniref:Secreted protein n=1 Tax=Globisporangium ultimum (strain ATCC 200006 / CBS 805.95 / DAOM BR144) TaxID=431595 RepID=K3XCG0_GLOUD
MKSLVSCLTILLLMTQLPFASSTGCRRLVDNDNTLIRFASRIATSANASNSYQLPDALDVDETFAAFDAAFPWISQCAASIDYWETLVSLAKSDEALQCWTKWTYAASPQELDDEYFRHYYCPLLLKTSMPCINQVLMPAINAAMELTAQCCEPMKQRIPALFGLDLTSFVALSLRHLGNVLCSEKTFVSRTSGLPVTQTCAYSLLTSFISENIPETALLALQISNTQGCRAMSGLRFFSTQGITAQLFGNAGEEPVGVCYTPIDVLWQQVSTLPIVKNFILKNDDGRLIMHFASLFGAGRCLRGELLGSWITSESNLVLLFLGFVDTVADLFKRFGVTTREWNSALASLNASYARADSIRSELHQQQLNSTNAILR